MVPFGYGARSRQPGTAWEMNRQARVAAAVAVAAVDRIAVVERQRIQRRPIGTIRHIRVSERGRVAGEEYGMSNTGGDCCSNYSLECHCLCSCPGICLPLCSWMKSNGAADCDWPANVEPWLLQSNEDFIHNLINDYKHILGRMNIIFTKHEQPEIRRGSLLGWGALFR